MIIGAYLHAAAPEHGAGAEWTVHDTFVQLARAGHDCRIVATKGTLRERINGVMVYSQPTPEETAQHFQACDVMFTQLDATMDAQMLAATYQTPLVHWMHSPSQVERLGVIPSCCALLLSNSRHVFDANGWWPGEHQICRPHVDGDRVRIPGDPNGRCATLINTSHNKGGPAFFHMAQRLSDIGFLGVMGAYGEQAITPEGIPGGPPKFTPTGLPSNMRVSMHTSDIRGIFAYTRVLLVLSHAESYGRVAQEAMINRIPVIATRTPGLIETCGPAAYYVDRDNPDGLQHAIEEMFTPEWTEWSTLAFDRARVNQSQTRGDLSALAKTLQRIADDQPEMTL